MKSLLQKRWCTGEEIISLGIKDFELLDVVKNGKLTPYDNEKGFKVVDVSTLQRKKQSIEEIELSIRIEEKRVQSIINGRHTPSGRNDTLTEFKSLTENEIKAKAKKEYQNQQGTPIIPKDCIAVRFTKANVITFIYKSDEVDHYLKELNSVLSIKATSGHKSDIKETSINADEFICNLRVAYIDETSISIQPKGKNLQYFTREEMGFSPLSWKVLTEILKKGFYSVGLYDTKKNTANVKEYNKLSKRVGKCNKAFKAFLKNNFFVEIPEKYAIIENMKGRERAGTYKVKFSTKNKPSSNQSFKIGNLSEKETEEKIKILYERIKKEDDQDKKDQHIVEVGHYLEYAKKKKYRINDYQIFPDEYPSGQDVLSIADGVDDLSQFKDPSSDN